MLTDQLTNQDTVKIETLDELYNVISVPMNEHNIFMIRNGVVLYTLKAATQLWYLVFGNNIFQSGDSVSALKLLKCLKVKPRIAMSTEIVKNLNKIPGTRDQYEFIEGVTLTVISMCHDRAIIEVH